MTKLQARFVELEKQKESVKKFYEELNQAVEDLSKEIGVNGYFQDGEGTVYKVVVPKGKWVAFEPLSYVRTRRMDEEASPLPLSLKEAEAAGFAVAKKK